VKFEPKERKELEDYTPTSGLRSRATIGRYVDQMTLTHELDLDIVKMYVRTKIKFLGQGFRKLEPVMGKN